MDGTGDHHVRALGPDDAEVSRRLGWEAFGDPPAGVRETPASWPPQPGMRTAGLFGSGGDLRARMVDREYDSWFAGVPVPTAGIAGVTVAAEHRGRGLLGPLFEHVLHSARDRGAVISTLFPTAPGIYRRFGYEIVGSLDTVELPTTALAAVRDPGGDLVVRRATVADVPGVHATYDAWASAQNGPLTRRGPSFPATPQDLVSSFTGLSVAVDARGTVHGYVTWSRGTGYGEGARLEVLDLVATRRDATAHLLRLLGSFSSVIRTTRIRTSGGPVGDVLRLLVPAVDWRVVEQEPYMLRLLDPGRALGLRRFPPGVSADLSFTLTDDLLHDLDGGWRLTVRDGEATCERSAETAGARFSGRGLAMMYAGAQGTANLRMAGLLEGADSDDAVWDVLFGGHQVHIRDYF
jgi:predicted acetyltransferase